MSFDLTYDICHVSGEVCGKFPEACKEKTVLVNF